MRCISMRYVALLAGCILAGPALGQTRVGGSLSQVGGATGTPGLSVGAPTGTSSDTSGDVDISGKYRVNGSSTASPANGGTGTGTAPTANQTLCGTAGGVYVPCNPGQPSFQASLATGQSVTTATWTKAQFATVAWDTCSCYDAATNYRYTPTTAGRYRVTVQIAVNNSAGTAGGSEGAAIYKNGSVVSQDYVVTANGNAFTGTYNTTQTIQMNGTTDYIEGWGISTGATAPIFVGANLIVGGTFMEAVYVGP